MRRHLLAALIVVGACDTPTGPEPAELTEPTQRWANHASCSLSSPATPLNPLLRVPRETEVETFDDRVARRTRSVPGGYGGYYLEDGSSVVILLQSPWMKETAVRALREKGIIPSAPDVVIHARWSFAQLYDWRAYLDLRTEHAWDLADIDEVGNRITYGFVTEDARTAFEARLRDIGIPCYLVVTEVSDVPIPRLRTR